MKLKKVFSIVGLGTLVIVNSTNASYKKAGCTSRSLTYSKPTLRTNSISP